MAKVIKSKKGYRVEHSITGANLTGTFTGRGAEGRARTAARKIRKRNS